MLDGWTSLAQWVGTERGVDAVAKVAAVWPGYERHASRSILNAYYTDPDVIATVWNWLEDHGVTEGHGFEPGCGRGDWLEMAPNGISFDAVDIDPVSVAVARARTATRPVMVVESSIEAWTPGHSSAREHQDGYDLVVGNVPFSSHRPGLNNPHSDNLHNLSIARSVGMLRPGGVAAVLTSRFSLDGADTGWRERLAAEVDLVAAFRLPSRTHREAGTDVVTDLLIVRRPLPGENRPDPAWISTSEIALDADTTTRVNRYWSDHPNHVLGEIRPGGAYSRSNFTVDAGEQPAWKLLDDELANVTVDYAPAGACPAQIEPGTFPHRTSHGRALPAGSIVIDPLTNTGFSRDGREHRCTKKGAHRLRSLIELRDRALEYLDDPSEEGRTELAALYAGYREIYPPLNSYKLADDGSKTADHDDEDGTDDSVKSSTSRVYERMDGFRTDPSWWTVAALESFDDDTGTATPAPILCRPVVAVDTDVWPTTAANVSQAVANSLSRWHRIDVGYVARQLDVDETVAAAELATVAFETPTGEWQLSARYLSGDVVGAYEAAVAAAADEPARFGRNVEALRAALPTPLTAAEITPEFGATWLTPDVLEQFIADHGGGDVAIKYHPPTGQWSSDSYGGYGPAQFRTGRYSMLEEVLRACNAKPVTINTKVQSGDRELTVVDVEATAAEQLCRDNLTEALQTWCWADPDRSTELTGRYNRLFNRYRAERWDGAHLDLPGLAADFTPRPHQKDVVWRILAGTETGTLMSHGVGAGKTAAMIIAGHETRRTGRVNGTTMFAVPGNMVEQFARDYLRLYPAARVLTPTAGMTQRDATREFAARVATGDYDAAICSHNHLKAIPLSPAVEAAVLERRLEDFATTDADSTLSRSAAKRWARQIEKQTSRLKELKTAAEDPAATYFDRMGVGMVFVDEAHLAKNIGLNTNRSGLPMPQASQRAEAILARADHVRDVNGPASVVMATATPITNSPAEMWVAARLVAPDALTKSGIEHFDGFAANFLAPVETVEHTAGGKLKVVTRLGEYKNFPDLARMFRSFTDVKRTDSLGFTLPGLVGGEPVLHVAEPTDQQLAVSEWARERSEGRHLHLPDGVVDPAIAILGTARAAALHPATISTETCAKWATTNFRDLTFTWDEPNPKLIEAADTIAAIYQRTAQWQYSGSARTGAAQAVFCDAGVPTADGSTSVYSTLTDLLIDRGVDPTRIRWVHDEPDPNKRQVLWDQVRNGQIRILIGSTQQMGVGVNIQTRLYAMHELTAPYRPDSLEQAEGRGIRQGNENPNVELHRYITERTADARSWQILQRKAHFITQAMSDPDTLTRDLRDESVVSPAEEFAAIAALATGDNRHVQLAAVTATVTRLERAERAHQASIASQQRTLAGADRTIGAIETEIGTMTALTPQPVTDDDRDRIARRLVNASWNSTDHIDVGGVTWDVRRTYDTLCEIPGTRLRVRFDGASRASDPDGHKMVRELERQHRALPKTIELRRDDLERTRQQIESERARPIDPVFARAGELTEARTERDRLTAELMPVEVVDDEAAAVAADTIKGDRPAFAPAQPTAGHPVFGERTPTLPERWAWVGAYRTYTPDGPVHWGNRANTIDAWQDAVNAFSTEPANQHPTRRHDIGRFRGVSLHALIDGDRMRIEPRHAYTKLGYPVYQCEPGKVDVTALDQWLNTQAGLVTTERAALDTAKTEPHRLAPGHGRDITPGTTR